VFNVCSEARDELSELAKSNVTSTSSTPRVITIKTQSSSSTPTVSHSDTLQLSLKDGRGGEWERRREMNRGETRGGRERVGNGEGPRN